MFNFAHKVKTRAHTYEHRIVSLPSEANSFFFFFYDEKEKLFLLLKEHKRVSHKRFVFHT